MVVVENIWRRFFATVLVLLIPAQFAWSALTERRNEHGLRKDYNTVLQLWKQSLGTEDFNATHWMTRFRTRLLPQRYFAAYAKQLSDLWIRANITPPLNFALIGACDGTHDRTIEELYIPNHHWHGLFVEPVERNFNDLIKFLHKHHLDNRTTAVQAAVAGKCASVWPNGTANVAFRTSVLEDYRPDSPHWLRRQIGKILSSDEINEFQSQLDSRKWKIEKVPCSTPNDLKTFWMERTRYFLAFKMPAELALK
jgi:hypothetical protein